ncbi:MAG: alpha-(1-_3)-arabinofuranosyltransferase family protein [Solirubrobacteraceae bacterium]
MPAPLAAGAPWSRALREGPGMPLLLAAVSFVVAFVQLPGRTVTDSRIELSADPGLFLTRAADLWSSTGDLGHLQSGQFVGYLFPMGPWFALAQAAGIPMWIAQRLWLGLLLALAAWGAIRLMDALYGRPRGLAHLVAAVVFAFNPYVVVFAGRATVALLAYVCLPWLLVATHRGLASARSWHWPAVFGLVLACAGGGVNAALLPWIVLPAAGLALYEVAGRGCRLADVLSFGWRTLVCATVASLWWIIPVLLQARYGADFLAFLEQPRTVWATTSMSESLRLLGYWIVYVGSGFRGTPTPFVSVAPTYLFDYAVVVATLLIPVAAVLALRLRRGWSYGPYFGMLAAVTATVMAIGFPPGKPLNDLLTWIYENVSALQFLRTTYKAAPSLALAFACLSGVAAAAMLAHVRAGRLVVGKRTVPVWALAALAAVPILYALPVFTGQMLDARFAYRIPEYWRTAIADADRTTPPGYRLMTIPGQLFGRYRWGDTVDTIAPAISRRPVLSRAVVRYADPAASELQGAVDDLIQQGRLVPGQLEPLLRLLGVGQVIATADGNPNQSGEAGQAEVASTLATGFAGHPAAQSYGAVRTYLPEPGRGAIGVRVPDIARIPLARPGPGIVRVHSPVGGAVLDGDATGIADAAAVGSLDPKRVLFYAGDLAPAQVRAQIRSRAELVFTDSNRRQFLLGTRTDANLGPTLGPGDPIAGELPSYDLFPAKGPAAQTIAVYSGLRFIRAPASIAFALFPEHRPFAAFDGRLDTAWVSAAQDPDQRYLEFALRRPRPVAAVRIHPHADSLGLTRRIAVSVNGGAERTVRLRRGWNTVRVDARPLRTLRLRIVQVGPSIFPGRGGFDEIRVPGVTVREQLRLPTDLAAAASGDNTSRNGMTVILRRTTADFPFAAGADVGSAQADNVIDMVDAEPGLERLVTLPAQRGFTVGGWSTVSPTAPDPALDRLSGVPAGWAFASSSRFEGRPRNRASSAFDRSATTAWVGDLLKTGPRPWITVTAPRPFTLRRIRLIPAGPQYAYPKRVRLELGGRSVVSTVGPLGAIVLTDPLRGRTLRVTVLSTRLALGAAFGRLLRAVAVREIEIPGLDPPAPRRSGPFTAPCGSLTVAVPGSRVRARPVGELSALDAGRPLAIRGCGRSQALTLPRGTVPLSAPPGTVFRPDFLRLSSPALVPAPAPPAPVVLAQASGASGVRTSAKVALPGPSWLVLGASSSPGWKAACRDAKGHERDLGDPIRIDGFANGWAAGPSCVAAEFHYAPQRFATGSYVVSGLGCLALLVLIGAGVVRRRVWCAGAPDRPRLALWAPPPADPVRTLGWAAAVSVALAVGAVAGFLFALRAGIALGAGTLVLARVGFSARRLLALAFGLCVVLPVLYVGAPAPDLGGFYFGYAEHYLGAHWLAVAAVCALGAGCALALHGVRAARTPLPAPDDGPGVLRRRASAAAAGLRERRGRPRT